VTTTTGVMLDAAAATVRQDGYLRTGDQDQFHRKPWAGKRGRLGATVEVRTHCWLPSPTVALCSRTCAVRRPTVSRCARW
jgi:hypothetical protein